MNRKTIGALIIFVVLAWSASADTAVGTLTITTTATSSIGITIESAGGTFSGGGTSVGNAQLGNLSKYGVPPAGFTIARTASAWTLSSAVGIHIVKSNLTSPSYTLTATLGAAASAGLTWKMNGLTLIANVPATLTSAGVYGSTANYSWSIVVADTVPSLVSIDNTVFFTATSN